MLEVIPPVLAKHTVSDPHIRSFQVMVNGEMQFLQTSPEFALKKLLAKDKQAVYSLGSVFRQGEQGSRHQSEFLMLEWYRPGFTLSDLESEVADLISVLAESFGVQFQTPKSVTYAELFAKRFGLNPHKASISDLSQLITQEFPNLGEHLSGGTYNDYLDTLFSMGIEPDLCEPTFVREFPASQASLAKISDGDEPVALRSELYWDGLELTNAYDELRDSVALRQRIATDNKIRERSSLPRVETDEALLDALGNMPPCVGVAMGLDRLLMLLLEANNLNEVNPFS